MRRLPAHRLGVLPEPSLLLAQRLHLPVGHGRAPWRERGEDGRVQAAPPQEPSEGEGGHTGLGRRRSSHLVGEGAGYGPAGLLLPLGACCAVQGHADGRGAGSAVG